MIPALSEARDILEVINMNEGAKRAIEILNLILKLVQSTDFIEDSF